MAKKTNYIQIELDQFEKHVRELMMYLDQNSPMKIEDRTEHIPGKGDSPGYTKVLVTKEAQIKSYRDSLKEVPALLSALNTLRKEVEGAKEDVAVRGGQETPGFMDDDDDDAPAVAPEPIVKPKLDKPVKKSKSKLAGDDDDDDDDEIFAPITKPKKNTPPAAPQWETDEEFDED